MAPQQRGGDLQHRELFEISWMENEPTHSKEETDPLVLQPKWPLCGDRHESFPKNKILMSHAHLPKNS